VGAAGDFSTSATLHPAFGGAVGRWAGEELRTQGLRHLIECGPGDGSLLLHAARSLGRWTRLTRRIRLHLVETSPALRERQRKTLRALPVTWHESIEAALEVCGGEAVIYSNEFADAFPVHLIEWDADLGHWSEVAVEHDENWKVTAETLIPFDPDPDPDPELPCSGLEFPGVGPGQRIELGLDYRDWLRSMAARFRRGSLLTIDYGDRFPDLYHRRPRGTLRAFRGHQRLEGSAIYAEPGRRDITADVNFTDLDRWGQDLGWHTEALESQATFLARQDPGIAEQAAADPALAFLLEPTGAGGAFQVLHQRIGVAT